MSFEQMKTEDARLVLLRSLAEDPDYRLNESLLQTILDQFGHAMSRDRIRTELRWLEEQGLISVELVAGVTMVATLTTRGADVASGRARVDGVKRPSPRG